MTPYGHFVLDLAIERLSVDNVIILLNFLVRTVKTFVSKIRKYRRRLDNFKLD